MLKSLCLFLAVILFPGYLLAQTPNLKDEALSIREVADSPFEAVKLSYNPSDSLIYVLTQGGAIYSLDVESGTKTAVQSHSDHGLENVQGMDISSDGIGYIVGNHSNHQDATNTAVIKRAAIGSANPEWVTVAETEPYPLSNTDFDHVMNEMVLSPDDQTLYINSGSRTDHGEVQSVDGLYPELREADLTAKILQIPAESTDIYLENDIDYLESNGYIFAEGTRNTFGMAFDAQGNLFGPDNAGERDDPEGFNWLQEGKHYGFPWRAGGNDNPMQFEDYDPDEDMLLNTDARDDIFYNDPDFPPPPDDVTFTEPILNHGPDAVNYTDAETGEVFDASEQDTAITSLTGHRSPLGLVFDTDSLLTNGYAGDAFLFSLTGGDDNFFLLQHMDDSGEDLLHIELTKNGDEYEMTTTRIAGGFKNPIDAELVDNKLYVIEFKNDWLNGPQAITKIWEITFPERATHAGPDDELAGGFELHQNYPNPFNPATEISYSLSEPGEVILEVYDVTGRKVQTLVDTHQNAGEHQVTFDGGDLSSGLYVYRLQMAGSSEPAQTEKMLLVK